eukprot:12413156-Karenia_brevis.AAC.1
MGHRICSSNETSAPLSTCFDFLSTRLNNATYSLGADTLWNKLSHQALWPSTSFSLSSLPVSALISPDPYSKKRLSAQAPLALLAWQASLEAWNAL